MKSKTKTYVLLGAVLLIWGILGYRVVKAWMPDRGKVVPPIAVGELELDLPKARDTFSIMANYRDPFLGTTPSKSSKPKTKPATTVSPKDFTSVSYSGMVADQGTGQKLFFVNISGKEHMLQVGSEIEGVKLILGDAKSIRIREHGQVRTLQIGS